MIARESRVVVLALAVVVVACAAKPAPSGERAASGQSSPTQGAEATTGSEMPSYEEAIVAVAKNIEALKREYPQLAKFSAAKHCDAQRLVISYGYKTHRSQRRGGWTAAVPNPDKDGLWFHLDFHDPDSTAQIHTQPGVAPLFYRDKKVMLLILEGEETERVSNRLYEILVEHGVRDGQPD